MSDETEGALSLFHPLIRSWFLKSVGRPTEVQERAWPEIARGAHVLVSAPTGTGKTFTAFLWGINQLATGVLSPGKVRILYVSPLKALNNDIQRNLLSPLQELSTAFQQAGQSLPPIRVLTRSGDTSSTERQRMLRHPPEILITTPESLNLILSSPNGRLMLDGVAAVVLDEIHAVAATKRGTHLVTAVDRLVRLAGEFQRIALSATVKPLSVVADLVGGYQLESAAGEPVYRKRRVQVVHCPMAKDYDIRISYPAAAPTYPADLAPTYPADLASNSAPGEEPLFDALARDCRKIIAENRSTLFFVNSRRHAEKLARFINEGQPQTLAWSHHGSLSRELRLVVEQRLKRGELKAIVATSSLELGIDVGSLDQVILVQTPFNVASAVQRLGRAGHTVGQPSRGVIFPLHGKDIVDAAVTARCIREQDIDAITPVTCPLDVLAQVIVSMAAVEIWKVDELYDFIRAGFPYRTLARRQFDLVLDMLAGKYEETRLRDLAPMISYDRIDSTVRAREGARIRLATSGGTIPDRGYFSLRAADSKTLIGELDEEFVWERSLGDSFVFGTQGWRIQKIDHQNVEVVPVATRIGMSPFWKAEERNRDFHISDRIARTLEDWNGKIGNRDFAAAQEASHGLEPDAARAMTEFLARQREATGADLPHRHHLLVEHTRDPEGRAEGEYVVLHTLWGGRVNKPFGLALSAAWEEKYGYRPEMFQNNDAILLFLPEARSAQEILSLVPAGGLERLLRRSLEGSGFFGARFRESAGRALLLPRPSARRRMPFWLTRQRAKSLFSAVSRYDDFPLLLETWRTCLRDEFDLPHMSMLLEELSSGVIAIGEVSTAAPSPFCHGLLWKQTNSLMYADDTPPGAGGTSLRGELVRELALSPDLRPRLAAGVLADFQAKLQRTGAGYAPRDARELLDWVKERIILPHTEWQALLHACARDYGSSPESLEEELRAKIVTRSFGELSCVLARETLPRVERSLQAAEADAKSAGYVDAKSAEYVDALAELLSEWLRFYGPIEPSFVGRLFGLTQDRLGSLIRELAEEEQVVLDRLAAGSEALLLCDRENLEILLRISRARARPEVRTLPVARLPLFVARRQGLIERAGGPDEMKGKWEKLFGLPLPARAWEEEVFPARLQEYRTRWLDGLLAEAGLLWLGCGRQRLTFCFREDAELFLEAAPDETPAEALFESGAGKYSFWDFADKLRLSSAELTDRLWDLAWKGMVSCDSFQELRKGVDSGFRAGEAPPSDPGRGTPQNPRGTAMQNPQGTAVQNPRGTAMRILRSRAAGRGRPGFDRWQATRPTTGFWFRVQRGSAERDALDEEEIVRDRIRQVLQRYGVLFREVLENELPLLRWSRLFRSLRLMEFSGEVVAGRFFEGIRGLQFAAPSLIEEWVDAESAGYVGAESAGPVWWVNAADPASLCGVDIEALKPVLPSRLPTTHVVFHGDAVVLVSRRKGLELEFRVPPESPRIPEYLSFVKVLTGREWRPMSAVRVETINDEPVGKSPYRERLVEFGFVEDYRRLTYRARV